MATGGPGPSTAAPSRQTQRIQKDLQALIENPLTFVRNLQLAFVDGVNELSGTLIGPDDSPYAGGYFRFLIRFPPEYPFKSPEFFFCTAIIHPNVDTTTGISCHDQLLATWAPSITLAHLLKEMRSLLAKPNYETPLRGDKEEDKSPEKARRWTAEFAQPL